MEGIIHATARLVRASQNAYTKKWSFFALFVSVFIVSVFVLARLDLLPDVAKTESAVALVPAVTLTENTTVANTATTTPATQHTTVGAVLVPAAAEAPIKISIPSIGLTASVANPTSTSNAVLDQALLSGAVRYPTSATLGQDNGNVVIFGHSSYLPIVHNQAYKTFDGIQKLHAGDTISVYSSGAVYTYAVTSVTKESAASDAGIPLSVTGKLLTLATCDSFGAKTDRFVVVAHFVESHSSIAS